MEFQAEKAQRYGGFFISAKVDSFTLETVKKLFEASYMDEGLILALDAEARLLPLLQNDEIYIEIDSEDQNKVSKFVGYLNRLVAKKCSQKYKISYLAAEDKPARRGSVVVTKEDVIQAMQSYLPTGKLILQFTPEKTFGGRHPYAMGEFTASDGKDSLADSVAEGLARLEGGDNITLYTAKGLLQVCLA